MFPLGPSERGVRPLAWPSVCLLSQLCQGGLTCPSEEFLQQMRSLLKNPGEDSEGWNGEVARDREKWGVDEAGDMSYFDIPTVPFELMNFHFRGQSVSVTATLVLWPKTANCRL